MGFILYDNRYSKFLHPTTKFLNQHIDPYDYASLQNFSHDYFINERHLESTFVIKKLCDEVLKQNTNFNNSGDDISKYPMLNEGPDLLNACALWVHGSDI